MKWPRSWLKTDFPVLQNAFGRSLRGTASADAQRTPSSSREYAEAACADWSTQSALLLGRQPPRGEQWATSLRSTTATWLSLQLSESHHNSRCERYPKGQEAVWASASSWATVQKQQISSHQACRRTSIPVKPGRSQTRHSRQGGTAARQLVSMPQSQTKPTARAAHVLGRTNRAARIEVDQRSSALPDSLAQSALWIRGIARGCKDDVRG